MIKYAWLLCIVISTFKLGHASDHVDYKLVFGFGSDAEKSFYHLDLTDQALSSFEKNSFKDFHKNKLFHESFSIILRTPTSEKIIKDYLKKFIFNEDKRDTYYRQMIRDLKDSNVLKKFSEVDASRPKSAEEAEYIKRRTDYLLILKSNRESIIENNLKNYTDIHGKNCIKSSDFYHFQVKPYFWFESYTPRISCRITCNPGYKLNNALIDEFGEETHRVVSHQSQLCLPRPNTYIGESENDCPPAIPVEDFAYDLMKIQGRLVSSNLGYAADLNVTFVPAEENKRNALETLKSQDLPISVRKQAVINLFGPGSNSLMDLPVEYEEALKSIFLTSNSKDRKQLMASLLESLQKSAESLKDSEKDQNKLKSSFYTRLKEKFLLNENSPLSLPNEKPSDEWLLRARIGEFLDPLKQDGLLTQEAWEYLRRNKNK